MQHTLERTTQSPDLLKEAGREFYQVCNAVDQAYESQGVDIDRINPEHYWLSVADASKRIVEEKYSTIENLSPKGTALELAASTPYFILTQQRMNALNAGHIEMPREEIKRRVYFMSYYNGLVRDYAASHQSITTHEMNSALTDIAKKTEVSKHPEHLRGLLAESINGAQHELITGQVLNLLGDVRPASTQEDLQGIDLILKLPEIDHALPIDVKASSSTLYHASSGKSDRSWITNRGVLMMWSQLSDEQLGGRFYLSEEDASRHATRLRPEVMKHAHSNLLKRVEY